MWHTLDWIITKYSSNVNPSVIYEQLSTYQHHHFVSFSCQPFSKSVTNNPKTCVKKSHAKRCNFMQIILSKWSHFHRLWFQTMHKHKAFCKKCPQKRLIGMFQRVPRSFCSPTYTQGKTIQKHIFFIQALMNNQRAKKRR